VAFNGLNVTSSRDIPQPCTRPERLTWKPGGSGGGMSLLKRLFGPEKPPKQRIRICVECGMSVAEHKDWCAILRTQNEMEAGKQREQ
jgi:hypothetical protein